MQKFALSLTILCLHGLAFGQTALSAAKSDASPVSTAQSSSPAFPLLQMVIIAVVLFGLLKIFGPKMKSFAGSKVRPGFDSSLRVEESATLAQGALYVVTVRGKTLLLGATTNGVNLLSDLTEAEKRELAEPVFFEHLDHALASDVSLEPAAMAVVDDSPQARLERLTRGLR